MKRDVEFKSKGVTCRGWLITPDEGSGPFPVVIMAGGWCYVKEIVMPHYAKKFAENGMAALLFDYRCLGESDGTPRQHISFYDQVEDYKNAITFAENQPELDPQRIGIWGISYSGGHVLIVGATDPRVKCIVSTIPVVDGYENMKQVHGSIRFRDLCETIMEDRRKRFKEPESHGHLAMAAPDPQKTLSTWPFPETYNNFMTIKEKEAPNHEHYSTIESTELLMSYTVFPYVKRIADIPTLMLVAEKDDITLWEKEIDAFNQISTIEKKLYIIRDTSHMKLYSDMSALEVAAKVATDWLAKHLVDPFT